MERFHIRVSLADSHPLIMEGLKHVLAQVPAINLTCMNTASADLLDGLAADTADVTLIGSASREVESDSGLTLLSMIKKRYPKLRVVSLIERENAVTIQSMLSLGITGVVSTLDDTGHILTAIYAGYAGGNYLSPLCEKILKRAAQYQSGRVQALSPCEAEVLRLFVSGLTVGEIADHLQKRKQTVSAQKMSAMRKLGIRRTADLYKFGETLQVGAPPIEMRGAPEMRAPSSEVALA